MKTNPLAVLLLSGGLDSTTTLAIAQHEGFAVHALSFHYGQRHSIELDAARKIAEHFGVEKHLIVPIDLRLFGGSALTADLEVPKDRSPEQMGQDIPITYVPARNTIFLSFALAYAEVLGLAGHLPRASTPSIIPAIPIAGRSTSPRSRTLANLATRAGVEGKLKLRIHTPLIQMTKAQIIRRGLELGVDYAMTTSCYDPSPDGAACGRCDSCVLRLKGFAENEMPDPARYQSKNRLDEADGA